MLQFLALSIGLSPLLFASAKASVAYWVYGQEHQETIVLIHGFNSSHKTWDGLVSILSKRYRVIVYDQPGHGLSTADGKDFSPLRMASELNSLLNHLEIARVHIVGHSMGGRTALEFASRYPNRVKSALVEDMSALSISDSVKALPGNIEKYDKVKAGVPESFKNMAEAMVILSRYYTTEEVYWILAAAETLSDGSVKLGNRPEVTALYLHQGLAQDMTNELRAIRAKLAFFAADPASGTAVLKGEGIAHIRSVRPDVQIRVFPKAHHTIHARREFVEALLTFIEQKESYPHAQVFSRSH